MGKIEIPLETQYPCVSILQECQSKPLKTLSFYHWYIQYPLIPCEYITYPLSKLFSSNIVNLFEDRGPI